MRTANPALNEKTFESIRAESSTDAMTIQGTVNKTLLLLLFLLIGAGWIWTRFYTTGSARAAG